LRGAGDSEVEKSSKLERKRQQQHEGKHACAPLFSKGLEDIAATL
jgi:hypothetical protein